MSSVEEIERALESLRLNIDENRLASAYLLIGAPQGNAKIFAQSFLKMLFCSAEQKPCHVCANCLRVEQKTHSDLYWIEPESKGRVIKVEQIREMLQQVSQTSYAGGWKAVVIVQADRLHESAANAFLKTLEEPPGKCIFLLLTDAPQALLPTILSRCQKISLETEVRHPVGEWLEPLLEQLRQASPLVLDQIALAHGLKAILEQERKKLTAQEKTEDEDKDVLEARIQSRVLNIRADLLHALLMWHRDILYVVLNMPTDLLYFPKELAVYRQKSAGLSYQKARLNLQTIQTMIRRLDRNMPDVWVFEEGFLGMGSGIKM